MYMYTETKFQCMCPPTRYCTGMEIRDTHPTGAHVSIVINRIQVLWERSDLGENAKRRQKVVEGYSCKCPAMYAGVLHTLHTWYCGTFVLCTFMINVIKLSLGTFLYTTGTTCTCTCIQHKLKFQFNISVDLHVFYIAYGATGARVLYMNV